MAYDSGAPAACPRCGHENPTDTRYCNECGLRIDGLCPVCGTQNEPASHFCGNCGFDFVQSSPRQAAADDLRNQPAQPPAPAAVQCPRCRHVNEPGAVYCYNCGLPLDAAAGVPAEAASGAPVFATSRPVGFWVRLVSLIVDGFIVLAIYGLLAPIVIDESLIETLETLRQGVQTQRSTLFDGALSVLYGAVLLGLWGTTVGKRVFSVRVRTVEGSRTSFLRALGRELVKTISLAFFPIALISVVLVAFRPDKRALHDLLAQTAVIR
jgi:uncharacterized RDD family membrane protein YckC